MFVSAHVPVCDPRPFDHPASVLRRPVWLEPDDRAFVRSFGRVLSRRRDAPFPSVWADERYFADARNIIKFDMGVIKQVIADSPIWDIQVLYRRLYRGPAPVRRVEIGMRVRLSPLAPRSAATFRRLLLTLTNLPVRLRGFREAEEQTDLFTALAHLGDRYTRATTPTPAHGTQGHGPKETAPRCAPMLMLEHDMFEQFSIGPEFRAIDAENDVLGDLACSGFRYGLLRRRHLKASVWVFEPWSLRSQDERHVRSALARLHAERECLNTVLKLVISGRLGPDPGTPESRDLLRYLEKAMAFLGKNTISRIPHESLRRVLELHERALPEADRTSLLARLREQSAELADRIDAFLSKRSKFSVGTVEQLVIMNEAPRVATFINRSNGVESKVINIGDNNTINAPITVAEHIENSFNAVRDLTPEDDRRRLIEDLGKQIAELGEKMTDKDEAAQAGRKLETLANEAAAPKPDKSLLEFTGKGLIDAAKTVAEMAGPVTKTVTTLLKLFAIAI